MAASIDLVQLDIAVDRLDVNDHWHWHAFGLVTTSDDADDDVDVEAVAAADGDAAVADVETRYLPSVHGGMTSRKRSGKSPDLPTNYIRHVDIGQLQLLCVDDDSSPFRIIERADPIVYSLCWYSLQSVYAAVSTSARCSMPVQFSLETRVRLQK
jgi:hypothetical protein